MMPAQLPLTFEFRANQTFDDYFPGNNLEIYQQIRKFASGTGEEFIYLWGNPGHGKTHLLNACCGEASRWHLKSFYLDLTDSISANPGLFIGLEEFEIVCLDNIDALAGYVDWELALFNFYNQQRDRAHKLLVSAKCPPGAINFNLPDLQSRVAWGLALKINDFDDGNKIAALSFKAQQKGLELSPQAARFLLTRHERGITSLWSLLDKLDLASLAAKRKLTIPFLKEILDQPEK